MKSISRFKNILKGVICAVTLLMAATSHAGKATYTYDAYDRLDQLSYQDGPAFKYSYNESGSTVSKKLDGNRLRIYIFPDSSGNGEGSVSVSSNDATCGTDCYIYDAPTFVTLSTVPANSGFAFGYWSDPACGNSSTCDVYVDSIKLIKAHFTLVENTLRNYTANVTFNSQGAVSPDTPQIVQYGERINYSLTPFEPFQIASASGCNGTLNRGANTYEAGPIDESCTIDIAFGPLLNISKDGSGTGIVQDTSGAISCGDNCSAAFRHGTTVYFEAFPGSESIFSGWSSSGCSGTGNCNFTVLNPETVKATFTDMRPAAPSDLTAQVVSAKEVTLNWTQNSDDEDGFRIERKIGVLDTYTEVGTVGADETTFNDVGLIVGQSYYYRVAAYNGYGSSPYSNETSIVTYTLPMGNALDFDGVDDVVVVGNEASFDFYSTTPFTLEALVRVEEKGSGHHIIMAKQEAALDNISGSGYYLSVNEFEAGNGRLTFTMHGAAGYSEVYGTKDLIDGQWHHVAVVYSGSNFINGVSLYIDGVAELLTVDTDTLNGSSILNDAPLTVGTITNNPANIAFNGLIDEVRVWNVARTAQELFDNINVDLNGIGSGLVAEWRFEEGTGQLTLDGSLNDNDGQLGDTSGEDGNDPVWVFTGQEYTITVNVTGGIGGSLNPAGDVTVYSGGRETFEILPDRRYKVKDVFINTSSIGAVYSYEFTDVTSNQGIEVEFYEVLPSGYALDFTRSESDVVFTEN
ncbi:MAG: fibronectin type III domain-containing protein, partial [Deltaproteobacteria bacterium]|nr:fibronectin type III domain-containing protein [Deltaproteobacteria bacterium]